MTSTDFLASRDPPPAVRSFNTCGDAHVQPLSWRSAEVNDRGQVRKVCAQCGRFMGWTEAKGRGMRGEGRG